MRTRLMLATAAALLAGTVIAGAQNPPGSEVQDRGIREDLNRPATGGESNPGTIQDQRSGGTVGSGVGQGQPGPKGGLQPPGGRYQSEGVNEEIGKLPDGSRRRN